jgi:type I restriction enzyme S subunit
MTGATIGKAGRVRTDEPIYLNQRVAKISAKAGNEFDDFIFALVSQQGFDTLVVNNASGSAQANVSAEGIGQILVPEFPPDEQLQIGRTIAGFDDKIELNRRINKTLEAMARAIFKSWFVDFDPVRAKSEGHQPFGMDADTAALFPSSFENSTAGEIPKDWTMTNLGQVAENPRRVTSPDDVPPSTPYIGLEHMPRKSIALATWGRSEQVTSGKSSFLEGEILFGKLRPYFHKVGVAPLDGVCSTDIVVIKAKSPEWFGIVLGYVSGKDFVDYANAVSTGTKMPRTNWQDMARYEICSPQRRVAEKFTSLVQSFVKKIHQNIHESRILAAVRDALLPKLISGEIRVKDAEQVIGAKS